MASVKGAGTPSYSMVDMIISLLVIFILLLVSYLRDEYASSELAKEKSTEILDVIADYIRELAVYGVNVEKIDAFNVAIIVSEEALKFDVGKNTLDEKSVSFIENLGKIILDVLGKYKEFIAQITVEGHTDHRLKANVFNEFYNWDLSQERANAVMKIFFSRFKGHEFLDQFKRITLFGGRGPIECEYGAEADPELTAKCRTVKIKIRTRSKDELELLKK